MMMALYAFGVGDLPSVGVPARRDAAKSLILVGITSSQPERCLGL